MERKPIEFLTETGKNIARLGRSIGNKTDKVVRGIADTVGEKTTGILHSGKEVAGKTKRELRTTFEKAQDKLKKQKQKISHLKH
jgi:hypothetical protein